MRVEEEKLSKEILKESKDINKQWKKAKIEKQAMIKNAMIGETILFEMAGRTEAIKNFGIGNILNISKEGYIHFQWLGQYSTYVSTIKGTFKNGWIDTKKNLEYYKRKPESNKHEPFTGKMTETDIHISEILLTGKDNILNASHKLTTQALKYLQ